MNATRIADAAAEIAARVINGKVDLFLGCHEALRIRSSLPEVPDEVWDVLAGVASEIDGLPIGEERKYWDPEVLESKDRELEDYRRRIRGVVVKAFEELRTSLNR